MIIRLIGATFIICGCGFMGFKLAADHIKQIGYLKQLLLALDHLYSELQYRLSPLPELCRQASSRTKGVLSVFFIMLTKELEAQIAPDVERCVSAALYRCKGIPDELFRLLELLGQSLGRFDLEGQLNGLCVVKSECEQVIEKLSKNNDLRIRNYKTLALCAGAALAILFI